MRDQTNEGRVVLHGTCHVRNSQRISFGRPYLKKGHTVVQGALILHKKKRQGGYK